MTEKSKMAELFNFERKFDFEIQYGGRVRYFHQFFSPTTPENMLAFVLKTRLVNTTSGLAKLSSLNSASRNFFELCKNSTKNPF